MIGVSLSYLYRTTDVILYTAKNFIQGSLGQTVKRLVSNFAVLGLMVWGGFRFIPQQMDGWVRWFGYAVLYGICTCIAFAAVNLALNPQEGKALWKRVRDLLKH